MLIEREAELAQLRAAVGAGRAGVLVTVTGPPGIGKSSLLRELASEAVARGDSVVLSGIGTRVGAGVAHGILHQLFRPLARAAEIGGAPFDGPGSVLQELVLQSQVPADGVAIAYAVHWTLSTLARSGPVLLVIDDVQWADPVSATVIAQVSALVGADPVTIVLGAREAPRETSGPAGELVSMASTVIRPRPLSAHGIGALIGTGPAESDRVRDLSGGIPFYIAELAGLLAAGEELGPPPRVIESVMSRLEALGSGALAVTRAVCVLGPEARLHVVGRLAGVTEDELDDLARTLAAEGILGGDSHEPMLPIAHPLVADAVLAGTGTVRLAALRAAAAAILHEEGIPAPRVAAQLLLSEPGQHPWHLAVLREAAEEAMSTGAFAGAVELLERALLERALTDRQRGELLGLLGSAHFGVGNGSAAAAAWRRGLEYLDLLGQGKRMVDIGDALYLAADYPAAEDAYGAGVELFDSAGLDRASAPALDCSARYATARLTVEPMAAVVPVDVLRTVLARPSDGREERRFLATAATSAHNRQEWSLDPDMLAQRAYGGGAFAVEGFADDPTTYLLSGSLYLAGRYGDALELLGRAVEDARGRNRLASEVSARGVRGPHRILSGDLRAGIDDLEVAVNLGRLGPGLYHVLASAMLIRFSIAAGELDAAAGAAQSLEHLDLPASHRAIWLLGRAEHALASGAPEEAMRLAADSRRLDPEGGFAWTFSWRGILAASAFVLGDPGRAAELNAEERELLEARRIPRPAHLDAELLRSRLIDPQDAHAALEAYFDALPAGHRWQRARIAERMAELEIAAGEADTAQGHLLLALACALEQGIEPLERRVRAALKSIGREPIPSAMERRKQSLTAAELRVALRAVTGLSNREVARELFVTPKTVEFHLARIFRKLGVGSRQELAAAFDDRA